VQIVVSLRLRMCVSLQWAEVPQEWGQDRSRNQTEGYRVKIHISCRCRHCSSTGATENLEAN
jgi:hypothetical protein